MNVNIRCLLLNILNTDLLNLTYQTGVGRYAKEQVALLCISTAVLAQVPWELLPLRWDAGPGAKLLCDCNAS